MMKVAARLGTKRGATPSLFHLLDAGTSHLMPTASSTATLMRNQVSGHRSLGDDEKAKQQSVDFRPFKHALVRSRGTGGGVRREFVKDTTHAPRGRARRDAPGRRCRTCRLRHAAA